MSEDLQNTYKLLLPAQLHDLLNYVGLLLAYYNVLSSSTAVLSSSWKEGSLSILLICLVPWGSAEYIAGCSLSLVRLWQAWKLYERDVNLGCASLSSV